MKKLKLLILVLLTFQGYVFAQNIQITGKVSDPDNQALTDVNVTVRGGKQGAITNGAGNYTITAPANASLVFSHVGFLDQEEKVKRPFGRERYFTSE